GLAPRAGGFPPRFPPQTPGAGPLPRAWRGAISPQNRPPPRLGGVFLAPAGDAGHGLRLRTGTPGSAAGPAGPRLADRSRHRGGTAGPQGDGPDRGACLVRVDGAV